MGHLLEGHWGILNVENHRYILIRQLLRQNQEWTRDFKASREPIRMHYIKDVEFLLSEIDRLNSELKKIKG